MIPSLLLAALAGHTCHSLFITALIRIAQAFGSVLFITFALTVSWVGANGPRAAERYAIAERGES